MINSSVSVENNGRAWKCTSRLTGVLMLCLCLQWSRSRSRSRSASPVRSRSLSPSRSLVSLNNVWQCNIKYRNVSIIQGFVHKTNCITPLKFNLLSFMLKVFVNIINKTVLIQVFNSKRSLSPERLTASHLWPPPSGQQPTSVFYVSQTKTEVFHLWVYTYISFHQIKQWNHHILYQSNAAQSLHCQKEVSWDIDIN